METQKYTININFYRKITSTIMKHFYLLVSMILLFINDTYRKKKGKRKTKQNKKTKGLKTKKGNK